MRVEPASDSALFISFADVISPAVNRRVISLFNAIRRLRDTRIHNLHPAYSSLLIDFDPLRLTHKELENLLAPFLAESDSPNSETARAIEIPVCYEPEFAPDIAAVSERSRLTATQVVEMHSAADYSVYFLGFSPGFAYLGGLPDQIRVPRLATPRKHVHAGSVGIAGAQTGIYPHDSQGGWQLIGRTPLRMFDVSAERPSRLQPGDRVRFRPIDRAEFKSLTEKWDSLG
jgi:KipI family sensor histidine kinase inhibitor